eukprot:m.242022 g.242022  ORF g.242022 m.242022 type:complete len:496 (-) comp13955_c0_seq1:99-1586(-)
MAAQPAGEMTIFEAAKLGRLDVVKALAEGPDGAALLARKALADTGTALHFAALNGHVEVVRYLLSKVPEDNTPGITHPIHWACFRPNLPTIALLIANGADINVVDSESFTPIMRAAQRNQVLVTAFLLGRGARVDVADKDGDTALHWAVNKGNLALTRLLLSAGADPRARDRCGQTPLHLAVVGGSLDVVQELVRAGSSHSQEDDNGRTPLRLAQNRGPSHAHIAVFLKRLSAPAYSPDRLVRDSEGQDVWQRTVALLAVAVMVVVYYTKLAVTESVFGPSGHILFVCLLSLTLAGAARLHRAFPGLQQATAEGATFDLALRRFAENPSWTVADAEQALAKLCYVCKLVRTDRAHHCSRCRKCIIEFERHCPVLAVCVGQRTRRPYFVLLLLAAATCFVFIQQALIAVRNADGTINNLMGLSVAIAGASFAVCVLAAARMLFFALRGETQHEASHPESCPYIKGGINPYRRSPASNLAWYFCGARPAGPSRASDA